MALKYNCQFCGTRTDDTRKLCFNCREKYKILKGSGLFGGKAKMKKQKKKLYRTRWERTYTNKAGSETQNLIDYVNKSGTIHYGRYVAKERWLNGNN